LEGQDFIGMDMGADYINIAYSRIMYWMRNGEDAGKKQKKTKPPTAQGQLL